MEGRREPEMGWELLRGERLVVIGEVVEEHEVGVGRAF